MFRLETWKSTGDKFFTGLALRNWSHQSTIASGVLLPRVIRRVTTKPNANAQPQLVWVLRSGTFYSSPQQFVAVCTHLKPQKTNGITPKYRTVTPEAACSVPSLPPLNFIINTYIKRPSLDWPGAFFAFGHAFGYVFVVLVDISICNNDLKLEINWQFFKQFLRTPSPNKLPALYFSSMEKSKLQCFLNAKNIEKTIRPVIVIALSPSTS